MPADLQITITIPDSLRRALEPATFQTATVRAMGRAVEAVTRRAKLNLTGRFLRVRTGRLRSSVTNRVLIHGNDVLGVIGTNVFYGRIHELGVPHPWPIKSKRQGGLLRFTAGGKTIFARQVTHPAMAAKPWLSSAATESRADILAAFQSELTKALGT